MNNGFSGTTNITHAGIKKHFTRWKSDSIQAIVELVANGFDADAKRVEVEVNFNDLDGLESVSVLDNGKGINVDKCDEHFDRFYESLKRDNDDLQGTHGRGRLAFHLLCETATWYTRYEGKDAKLVIESSKLRNYRGSHLSVKEQHTLLLENLSGTCVELKNFTSNLPSLDVIEMRLANEFGWRLAINPERKLFLNGRQVEIAGHNLQTELIEIGPYSFSINFIRWFNKPGIEKSFNYLINKSGHIEHKKLSSFNKKPNFYLSTYAESEWIDSFNKSGGFNFTASEINASEDSSEYKKLQKFLNLKSQEIYEEFQRQFVDEQIVFFEDKGYFPSYKGVEGSQAQWRLNNTKRVIREVYLAEPAIFTNLKPKQTKVMLALLDKILISNENDALLDVLEGVVELSDERMEILANQLSKTSLEYIVSTIESLQKREIAAHKLRELMLTHYKNVYETPDLQLIIESNTWLFGEQHTTIGAEEDDFQKIALELRNQVKGINELTEEDFDDDTLESGLDIDGVRKQVDLFLAGKKVEFDSRNRKIYKCTIIEIKKPSISLNDKHLQQLKGYAKIIAQHPGFSDVNTRFELILVGRKVSSSAYDIESAIETAADKNEPGLVHYQGDGRIKGYVKTWSTILNEFELSNSYLIDQLKTKRGSLENKTSSQIVTELQNTVQ